MHTHRSPSPAGPQLGALAPAATLALALMLAPAALGQFTIDFSTVDGGGSSISGGPFAIDSTIGQHDASGVLSGGTFTIIGGYWSVPDIRCGPSDVAGPNQSIGPDGSLSADDIIVFLSSYFAFDPQADIAGQNQSIGPDGQFSADDIIVFLSRYFAGC